MPIVDDNTKKKLRSGMIKRRKDATVFTQQADKQIEHLLLRRFDRLVSVKRFIFLWVSLFVLIIFSSALQLRSLSLHYQSLQPISGGLYHEGLVGTFTNANPLFVAGTANTAVSRLVFSGLFKYDKNNNLVGDLATQYELNPAQTRYAVHLRQNVLWHDNKPFTADDVVFTYQAIQNPETQSTLFNSWKDIKVTKYDSDTVFFDLPNPLRAFPYALTNGIVPKHLLGSVPAPQLRSASFNSAPVGTGPFEWKFVDIIGSGTPQREQRISLSAFEDYWQGKPKLGGFNLITFTDERHLIAAFKKKQLNAMSGLESLPEDLREDDSVQSLYTPVTGSVMAFFNNSKPPLDNVNMRKALVAGVERKRVLDLFDEPVRLINGPLLAGQLGYDPSISQLAFNRDQANQLLDQAGWKRNESGNRAQGGKPLTVHLSAQETQEYAKVAQFLQRQWRQLGINTVVNFYNNDDMQGSIIANHDYEILLYGISIGVDPDVYAYWGSAQASVASQGRLNLSEYKSPVADQAIESARTRADDANRVVKYKTFLQAWVNDAPALALYQPNYLYVTRGTVYNYDRKAMNSAADRYYNAHNWMIRQQRQKI